MRPKGLIWTIPKKKLQSLYDNSNTLTEVLEKLGLYTAGNNRSILRRRQIKSSISTEKLNSNRIAYRRKLMKERYLITPESIDDLVNRLLVFGKRRDSGFLKKNLIRFNLLENKCNICGLPPIWNEQPLMLQLDHINGISYDNRLENLQIVCPNCHTQTDTYSGRNKKNGAV